MNVLFALYGGLDTNSAIPLALHAREMHREGHRCAVAIPDGARRDGVGADATLQVVEYAQAIANPAGIFADRRPADVLHAWTPREGVRRFVMRYLARTPTPWIVYLEDNEHWIARTALAAVRIPPERLLEHSEEVIATWTPEGLSHPLRYAHFIGLADGAAVIQDKLAAEVPPWVPCATVMPGVDLDRFGGPADRALRGRYGVAADERVIVYPGGLNDFTRPGLEALCLAVGIVNARGVRCRLLRSGPVPLDFLDRLPADAAVAVTELGALPREEMPALLALADVFVQPGNHEPFEDLRLPGKLPELFASARPVVLPDTNIASLLQDGVDAVLHRTGTPEEMAEKCLGLFSDPARAQRIGAAGRRFAESHFDPRAQAKRLLEVYEAARGAFDPEVTRALWDASAIDAPVPRLLAKRLRLLARSPGAQADMASMLIAYAKAIDETFERTRGLEKGMAVRDEHIASVEADKRRLSGELAHAQAALQASQTTLIQRDARVAALEASLSWRITRPLRMAADALARFARRR